MNNNLIITFLSFGILYAWWYFTEEREKERQLEKEEIERKKQHELYIKTLNPNLHFDEIRKLSAMDFHLLLSYLSYEASEKLILKIEECEKREEEITKN